VRVRIVVGILFCIAGLVWIGQGTNMVHGSSMSGEGQWTIIGAILLVLGAALLGWAWRLSHHRSS